MESSAAVEDRIREKFDELERSSEDITGARVTIEAPHRHQNKGKIYSVRIDLRLRDGEIVINREPARNHAHEDLFVAIRDAFLAADRRLDDHLRRRRGRVKRHEVPPHGRIASLIAGEPYGFIETPDGLEVYFHANSVINGCFDKLAVGDEVRVVLTEGDKGPQASTVTPIGKHHLVGSPS
jgi:cold shock CspA family protein/ribosome-associated translation inhibitor RaiA